MREQKLRARDCTASESVNFVISSKRLHTFLLSGSFIVRQLANGSWSLSRDADRPFDRLFLKSRKSWSLWDFDSLFFLWALLTGELLKTSDNPVTHRIGLSLYRRKSFIYHHLHSPLIWKKITLCSWVWLSVSIRAFVFWMILFSIKNNLYLRKSPNNGSI